MKKKKQKKNIFKLENKPLINVNFWGKILIILIFLIPYSLLYFNPNVYFPFIFPKTTLFIFLTSITFIIWLTLAISDRQFRVKKNWLLILLFLGLFSAFISNILAENPAQAFWSTIERMDGFLLQIYLIFYFLILAGSLKSKKLWIYFLNNLLIVGAIFGFHGLSENTDRISSWLGNPIYLAVLALFNFFISLYLAIEDYLKNFKIKSWKFLLYLFSAGFFLYILIKTGSRGPLLGIIGGLSFASLIYFFAEKQNKVWKNLAGLFFLIIIIFTSLFFYFKNDLAKNDFIQNSFFLNRLVNIGVQDENTIQRLDNWKMSYEAWQEKPIFGWGNDNYHYIYIKYFKPDSLDVPGLWFDRSHNVFFDKLVFYGLIGFLIYILLFLLAMIYIFRSEIFNSLQKSLWIGMLIAYALAIFTSFETLSSYVLFFSLLAFFTFRESEDKKAGRDLNKFIWVVPLVIALLSFFLYQYSWKSIQAMGYFKEYKKYETTLPYLKDCRENKEQVRLAIPLNFYLDYCRAMKEYDFVEEKKYLPMLKSAVNLLEVKAFFNYEIIKLFIFNKDLIMTARKSEEGKKLLNRLEKIIKEENLKNLNDPRGYYNYAVFLYYLRKDSEALKQIEKVLEIFPEKQEYQNLRDKLKKNLGK